MTISDSVRLTSPFPTDRLFEVSGYTLQESPDTGEVTSREFTYLAKNIVLATGSTDVPNKLGIPGEDAPFVLHSLKVSWSGAPRGVQRPRD